MNARFRIWDTQEKKMAFEGIHLFGEVNIFHLIDQYCFETRGDKSTLERYNDLVEMQWTTLEDNYHKPIYDGDILKSGQGNLFIVMWHEVQCCWFVNCITGDHQGPCELKKYMEENLQVVGSIYTHPELIK